MKKVCALLLLLPALSSCGVTGRLANVGKAPKLTPIEQAPAPLTERSLAQQDLKPRPPEAPNASLFRTGAGALFRDQRASHVGDILTIRINIADKAQVDNSTSRSRTGSETAGLAGLFGLQSTLSKALPGNPDPAKLVDANSNSQSGGTGNTTRSETINLTMAAIVTDVLPNGNLVIRGRQETRVNFELRELVITGIVRPEDIARDNSILHSQIAEARISYGGRGQLTDVQQARYGQQIYDALFPF